MAKRVLQPPEFPPDLNEMKYLAERVYADLPLFVRNMTAGITIHVIDFPEDDVVEDLDLDTPFELLGLYHGRRLDQKSITDLPDDLDRIFIFRRPMLDYWCDSGEALSDIMRHVLVHEIGHHAGLSDAQMMAIEAGEDTGEDDFPAA